MANIRIIDDDVELTNTLSEVLENGGHSTSVLNETKGAVENLLESLPDLIILDVMFPEDPSAGMELAIELRRNPQLKDIPVIMLTGVNEHFPMNFSEEDIDPEWLPVERFIEKPIDFRELLDLVSECISGANG
ncbi:MAG: response regulator [Kiritimatiellia bacterium]|nr:response regulator [Kiritimatiellia bacterium]